MAVIGEPRFNGGNGRNGRNPSSQKVWIWPGWTKLPAVIWMSDKVFMLAKGALLKYDPINYDWPDRVSEPVVIMERIEKVFQEYIEKSEITIGRYLNWSVEFT
jgi:hypothetical protein